MTAGTLYVVATPIGNLDDLSPRAKMILQDVDVIAAEDTRHTGRLLAKFTIGTPQISLHDHNEMEVAKSLIDTLLGGQSVALVSDAGTPLISDPGYRLVKLAHESGVAVSPVPGPSAAIAAMSVAGLPSDRFAFEGFLPPKQKARITKLQSLNADTRTLVFFESVHRVHDSLRDMTDVFGATRAAFIGREMSKLHEQCTYATLQELYESITAGDINARGEFVIAVAGAETEDADQAKIDASELLAELVNLLPGSQAVDLVARLSGRKRNEVYREMLKMGGDQDSAG